jgi:crotonobetainyl-CoA:carnitine CoA-transferase CaiB-like acyl-CoA transferase
MMPYTDAQWRSFFTEVGAPELTDDARFTDIAQRTKHIAELLELAGRFVAQATTAHWIAVCERLEIPAAPIMKLDDLPADEHLRETGFFEEIEDAAIGRLRFPGVPVRFDGQRPGVAMPPRLGQHTQELLAQAGVDKARTQALLAQGAAVAWNEDTK